MESTGRSKIFISYSREDLAFTNELVAALELAADFEILIDRVGIGHGEAWRERLGRLIIECDTMVFILSPDSISSEVCAWEIGEARRLAKRIVPVLWREVDFAAVPDELSALNAVPFTGENAVSGLPKLVIALNSDLEWLREHTRLGERAVEWAQSGRATAYLLRGAALVAVREWLAAKPANAPAPTPLQHKFIQASEEDESRLLSAERRRSEELEKAKAAAEAERDAAQQARTAEAIAAHRVVRATTAGLIVALVLFAAAAATGWFAYQKAEDEREAAERADQEAKRANEEAARASSFAEAVAEQRDAALMIQSRFLARAAQGFLTRGDTANAVALARAALPKDLAQPDRPFTIEPVQVIFDAYGSLRELATLRGHERGLDGALALPPGRIVTWGRDGTIRLWRDDGALLKVVPAHQHPSEPGASSDTGVHGVLRLEDGRLLSWGVDKTARLWTDDGTFSAEFLKETSWFEIERLHDGRIAALVGDEYRVWSAALEPQLTLRSPLKWMRGAKLLADGRFLTWQSDTGQRAHTAMLWNPDGTPGPVLAGHKRTIRGGFQLTGGQIVTFENGPGLRIWSAEGLLETVIDQVHKHVPLVPFAFPLRDGRFFTWGQEAYHDDVWWARLWNAQGESVALIEASATALQGIELDDGRLLLGANSRTPTIWHTDGNRGPMLSGHEAFAYGAEQWADGRIATHASDHTVRVWSRDGVPLRVLRGHEDGVSGVAPLPGERYLSWSFRDRTARIWGDDPQPRGLLRIAGGDAGNVLQLSTGSIAVHTNTGSIQLHGPDLGNGPILGNDARAVIGLTELSDGRLLTQGENHGNREPGPALRMWSPAGEIIADLAGADIEFLHVAQTPSGKIMAFERSGRAWVWRADGQVEAKHDATDTTLFYHVVSLPDGRLMTMSDDNRLQLWGIEGEPGRLLGTREKTLPKQVVSLADGQLLMIHPNGISRILDENGDRWLPLDLGENARTDTATPLHGGAILLNRFDGRLFVVNPDRSSREIRHPPGQDGRYRRHRVFKLADGRVLVSTDDQATYLWGADGEPGRQLLDRAIKGAALLSDGSFLVWPSADRSGLQIIHADGVPGPVLRGHEATIKHAFQLADGRILSWAGDATVRIWPGSIDQAIAWADEVISRLEPLTPDERCDHYLAPPGACAEVDDR